MKIIKIPDQKNRINEALSGENEVIPAEHYERRKKSGRPAWISSAIVPDYGRYDDIDASDFLPIFTDMSKAYSVTTGSIIQACQDMLRDHLANTNYDRLSMAEKFLDYVTENHMEDNLITAYNAFASSFNQAIFDDSSGNCISLNKDLQRRFDFRIPINTIVSTLPRSHYQPGFPFYAHVATAIYCSDGIILMDSGFHVPQPIILRPSIPMSIDLGSRGTWVFVYDGVRKIDCTICPNQTTMHWDEERQKKLRFTYYLRHILNPHSAISYPILAMDRKIPLVSRDSEGRKLAQLTINLDDYTLVLRRGNHNYVPLSLDSMAEYPKLLYSMIDTQTAALFKTDRDVLIRRIFKVIDGIPLLEELHKLMKETMASART